MSGLWREKADELYICNHMPNFGKWAFNWLLLHHFGISLFLIWQTRSIRVVGTMEGSFAEVGQVITGIGLDSFLTPAMS